MIPGLGRSPGEGNGYPLQYSCLGNLTDEGARLTTVCPESCKESDATEYTYTYTNGKRVSFRGNKIFLELIMVMVAQLCG